MFVHKIILHIYSAIETYLMSVGIVYMHTEDQLSAMSTKEMSNERMPLLRSSSASS